VARGKSGGKGWGASVTGTGPRWSLEEAGARGVVDVVRERREEKRALVPFVPKRFTHQGEERSEGGGGLVRHGTWMRRRGGWPHGVRRAWGAWRPARRATGGGGGRSGVCHAK
jgi:hypothetical protein